MTSENLVIVLIGAGFVIGGLAVFVLGWGLGRKYRRWVAAGTETEGSVVDIREYASGGSIRREPLVEYRDQGGNRLRAFGQSNRGLTLGASVRLVHDPEDPESILLAWDVERSARLLRRLSLIFAAVGAGLIAMGTL